MSGGIIQLVANGKEDIFLTKDPQITFFKIIYRRHTNFATEDVEQHFSNNPDFAKSSSCKISFEGDMIDRMSLKITLPEIPNIDHMTKFAWIRWIGFAMIKHVEIEINGRSIDKHYGEWLFIWNMLTSRNITDGGLNKLVGNVPELTDFTNGKNEYTLYVPLMFWFCRATGLSLPLIGLQFSDIYINVEFYEFDKCYVLSPTNYIKVDTSLVNFEPLEYLLQKGNDGVERYGMYSHFDIINKRLYYTAISREKFIGIPYDGDLQSMNPIIKNQILRSSISDKYTIKGMKTDFMVKPDPGVKSIGTHFKSLKNINLKECILLVNYLYLDNDERIKIAQTKQDYLIEQLHYNADVSVDSTNIKIKLDIDQPCKLTVWLAQLDYISNSNDRFNYTDSHIRIDGKETGSSLIVEEMIKLNSQVRVQKQNNAYFEFLQPIQYTNNTLPNGAGMYSYALLPLDITPSGTTNMSQIELIELYFKMVHKININNKAKIRSYSLCYNVLRVDNGLCGLLFVRKSIPNE